MKIENVKIFSPNGMFRRGSVEYNETIESVRTYDDVDVDNGPFLIPGLVEIHSHGALGSDHSNGNAEELRKMAAFYASRGVTSFLATTMTYFEDHLARALLNVRDYRREDGARCIGVNMEGPFLSYEKRGAHKADMLADPDYEMFRRLNDAADGMVKLISIAPERQGALDFIKKVASRDCHVSLAHTAADYDLAMRAFEAGATQVTHLFNAMPAFLHRAPGVIGAAMDAGAFAEVISDGMHLHPAVVRAAFRMFGDTACLISDSITTAGLPDGQYESGGQPVVVKDGKATLLDGTIAGSSISLMDGMKRAVSFGIPLEKAVAAATVTNARAIGMEDKVGVIRPGAYADFVLLDSNLDILKIIINGRERNA